MSILTVPSVLAGMPSVRTMRRSSSRLASTSPFCGPRWRKRSRCAIIVAFDWKSGVELAFTATKSSQANRKTESRPRRETTRVYEWRGRRSI